MTNTMNDQHSGTFTTDKLSAAFLTARCQRGQRINSTVACVVNHTDGTTVELDVFEVRTVSGTVLGFTTAHKLITVSFDDIASVVIK